MRSSSIIYSLLITFIFSTTAFAAPVTVSISGDQTVHVGDKVRINIFYRADPGTPIFTTSADLKYDNAALSYPETSFSSDWLPINKAPYELTEPGHLVRTAGFPSGFSSNIKFVTLSFVAKKSGPTTINLTSGMALDADNNDLGITARDFTINILGNEPVEKPQPVEEKNVAKEVEKPVVKETKVSNSELTTGTTTIKKVDTQIAKLSATGELKFDTKDLPEGEYVVIIKSATSTKKDKNLLEKHIQIVRDTTPVQTEKVEDDSFFVRILKFFGISW